MRIGVCFAVVVAVVVASLQPAAALCISMGLQASVLTTRDTVLPPDGGVLVGYQSGRDNDDTSGDPSNQPGWTASEGKATIALSRVSLAPGLSVYRPAAGTGGELILKDKKGTALGRFTRDPKAARSTLGAPRPKSLAVSVEQVRRGNRVHAVAHLLAAPPRLAFALIVYRIDKDSAKALSFVRLPDTHDELTELDVFEDAGRCGTLPQGSVPPAAGDKIGLAWADAYGRVSPISAPIVVK